MSASNCNHKWKNYPTYKQCTKCGEIIFSPEMSIINGIMSDENDDEQLTKDKEKHIDVPPLNDIHG